MQPFRYHVFACEQRKPDGLPCCSARGAAAVLEALRRELAVHKLLDVVQVTSCGSLGLCGRGPNLLVYPEGVWYSGVKAEDVPEMVREHFIHGRPLARLMNHDETAVRQEIIDSRNRMLTALKARDAAGVVPDELQEMIRGYQASRVILTALELNVFTAAQRRPQGISAEELAAELQTDPRATSALLNAIVALGLLSKQEDRFVNLPVASRYLVVGAADDATAALRHNLSLWATWSQLTQVVRQGRPAHVPEMDTRGEDWTKPFIAAMHKNAALRAPMIVQAVGAADVQKLIDIGGGSGAYAMAFAKANSALQAEVFDLATVVPIARGHIEQAGLSERVKTRVGDLRKDDFGSGYDLGLLSAICHMLGPEENRDLLKRVFACLEPGGRVVIQDHVMQDNKTHPKAGALFAINMLVGTEKGSTYSKDEYSRWLTKAGFTDVQHLPLAGPNDLMIARKP